MVVNLQWWKKFYSLVWEFKKCFPKIPISIFKPVYLILILYDPWCENRSEMCYKMQLEGRLSRFSAKDNNTFVILNHAAILLLRKIAFWVHQFYNLTFMPNSVKNRDSQTWLQIKILKILEKQVRYMLSNKHDVESSSLNGNEFKWKLRKKCCS